MLMNNFFDRDAQLVAKALLGKIIRVKYQQLWLSVMIVETEAYYKNEKGSHSSLGRTEKRKAMFMPAGTIYMYYARGADSLNISCQGEGNAVLVKAGIPYLAENTPVGMLACMQQLNKPLNNPLPRPLAKLCAGQTLLCRALNLKVNDWDQKNFDRTKFYIEDCGYQPEKIIQTTRLGIAAARDAHLPYRFIDYAYVTSCTNNPLTKRGWRQGSEYFVVTA